jgi:uncharacterized membrane protein (DUF2068 family)
MSKRPFGVTVIAILLIIGAVIGIVGGLMAVGVIGTATGVAVGVATLILSALQFIVALGLWSLQKWAWTLTVIVVILRIAGEVWALVAGGQLAASIASLVVNVIILLYLYSRKVRSAFA